ncbi:hypothetical protein QYE76_044492 [Lolium multiflorum]|uniref:CCHC-type domain-containing protein n=1 Tax=Lolium multiflorum TaxID=4521 RepID=A0AAD8WX50_LOLMU|nr:hypothetical protein QYE76_044492 [Lolium multiflorum]
MNYHTCGGKGHFKRDCPNRKVMIINDNDEYDTKDDVDPDAPEDDDYNSDGVYAFPSEARTIVVSQRALNVQPSASTQRCNLFQTKALVGPDKACKVIIDGGSCRDLASKEFCAKLKLKYLSHPTPAVSDRPPRRPARPHARTNRIPRLDSPAPAGYCAGANREGVLSDPSLVRSKLDRPVPGPVDRPPGRPCPSQSRPDSDLGRFRMPPN